MNKNNIKIVEVIKDLTVTINNQKFICKTGSKLLIYNNEVYTANLKNITIPYKDDIVNYIRYDEQSTKKAINAINNSKLETVKSTIIIFIVIVLLTFILLIKAMLSSTSVFVKITFVIFTVFSVGLGMLSISACTKYSDQPKLRSQLESILLGNFK